MLLRRMLRYIVIVSLVRAQRYVVPTLTIYLCSCDDAEEQKGCLRSSWHIHLYLCAMDGIITAR